MSSYIYVGTSKRSYSYLLNSADDLLRLPLQGGNYIFALNDRARTPVLIEAANNIRASVIQSDMQSWEIARRLYGAELVFIHTGFNHLAHDRLIEKWDLIAAYSPPMNQPPEIVA